MGSILIQLLFNSRRIGAKDDDNLIAFVALMFQMLNSPKSLRDDDIDSMEFLNTIPNLCPNLRKLSLGHRRADWPHSLCSNDVYADNDRQVAFISSSLFLLL